MEERVSCLCAKRAFVQRYFSNFDQYKMADIIPPVVHLFRIRVDLRPLQNDYFSQDKVQMNKII